MPWKTDEDGQLARTEKGNPVFLDDSGRESECDFPAMSRKLMENGKEAQSRKEEIRALKAALDPLREAGVEDVAAHLAEYRDLKARAEAARGAEGKGEEEKVAALKAELEKSYAAREGGLRAQLAELNGKAEALARERDELRGTFNAERLQRLFLDSQFARERCNVPPDMLCKLFGDRCGFDDSGRFQGRDEGGELVYGTSGDPAGFEEWLAAAVSRDRHAEGYLLKGSAASGSGAPPVSRGGAAANPYSKEHFNVTEQQRILGTDPGLAARLAKEAGAAAPAT
jgi:hypothetical protein